LTQANGSVLVVEDDAEINALVGAYAEICGFEYRCALTGADALAEARRVAPAAVILDLMLPDVDGFEVCRRLRGDPGTRRTPIIILSALGGESDRRKGSDCGADEYLTKPFDPELLMDTLKAHAGRGK
jgi:DNA-binding response OmpR family regulator